MAFLTENWKELKAMLPPTDSDKEYSLSMWAAEDIHACAYAEKRECTFQA